MKLNQPHRRLLSLLLLATSLLSAIPLSAVEFTVGPLTYYYTDDASTTVKVSECKRGASGELIIPGSVEYGGKTYTVTEVGSYAFRDCSRLTSVTIPNTVTKIGEWAFADCSDLTSVTIPNTVTKIGEVAFRKCSSLTSVTISNSVTSIGEWTFEGCSNLTSVTIPSSVTEIGHDAFSGCSSLTSVTIPNSVTEIGNAVFASCSSLTNIQVESDNPNYCSLDGVLFNSDKSMLVMFPAGRTGEYQVPNSVTSISYRAFYGCSSLTSVTIPNSVTSIESATFSGCSGLISVTIPNSVTSIDETAFASCSSLTSVTIPNSVTSIERATFSGCSGLISVTIPNSVTKIGSHAFSGCSSLTSVTIPSSVTNIDETAFASCSSLTNIQVESDNPNYCSLDGVLFNSDKSMLVMFPAGKTGEYQFPSSVMSIGEGAFLSCLGLTSVTIPNSVTKIGSSAFSGCSSLTSVTIPNSVTEIDKYTFYRCSSLTSVTIPNSVTTIGDSAFEDAGLTSVTIPNSVTTIGNWVFWYCSGLASVTIPNSVTSIGENVFHGCIGLNSVYVEWETPIKDNPGFTDENLDNATLYVPRGRVDAYKAVEPWSRFAHIEEWDPEMSGIDKVEQTEAQPAWHVEDGRLHIDGAPVSVRVFNAAGATVYNGPSDRIPALRPGVYIANGCKFIVR